MKTVHFNKTFRFYFRSSILLMIIVITGICVFRTSASDEGNENLTKDGLVSVHPKSQNTTAINLRPGRDLSGIYKSSDGSSDNLKTIQSRPLALATADFDVDGFPDVAAGYSSAEGGIVTLHKSNPEAFAPQTEETFAGIREGRFPDPFLENAQTFAIPAAPDFLVAGDFNRDGSTDVVAAARGGDKIYLLSGTGRDGDFEKLRAINLAGRVTALTAGEIDKSDNRADLAVGIEGGEGASLLIFADSENGLLASPTSYGLSSPAIALEAGNLDEDSFEDAAILTGDGVFILHGRDRRAAVEESAKSSSARMEKINLPFAPQALAIGNFIWNRTGKTQLALLAEDGSVRIAKRGELDDRPFSIEETRSNRLQTIQQRQRGEVVENSKTWQPHMSEDWTIADDSVNVAAPANRQNAALPILLKANLSGQNTDDIVFLNSETREIKILSKPDKTADENAYSNENGERLIYALETENQPTAMLSMRLNVFSRPGLVVLQNGKSEPSFVAAAPTALFEVDRADDTNAASAQVCSAAGSDCSLRGAISKANATPGPDMINLPAATYTLTLANAGANEDNNATGDLDITQDLTITGLGGQAGTIIQAGTNTTNGIDKVFASNPFCTSVVNTSFTGITVRYGRNTQPNGSPDFSYTGGGLDWCNTGAGGTLSITNSTFDSNSATTGPGGGIDLNTSSTTSGSVTLTGVTISNNRSSNPSAGGITIPADGGGLAALAGPYNLTITNSTITGNTAQTNTGGGIYFQHVSSANSVFQISGTTISNNSAFGQGGGINFVGSGTVSFTLNQNSTVSGNTSGIGGVAHGGGVFVQPFTGSATINKTTIRNNVLSSSTTSNRGGAGIAVGQGSATISYNRIVNNTGTTLGTGLNKDINPGTANAARNWWGCSTGPSAAPCDTAVLTPGSAGTLITSPWIVLRHTANPSTIAVGQSTTLTASFLTDSNGGALALADITVLLGLPISFNNPIRGTISNAQTTIQSNGTATATFTANAAGAGSADAIVDNDIAAAERTNRATITINKANTTATITGDSPDPSIVGQAYAVTVSLAVNSPGAGTPTGTITVSDGTGATCTITLPATSCNLTSTTAGVKTLTSTYNGDANFNQSPVSADVQHTVNNAPTAASVTVSGRVITAQGRGIRNVMITMIESQGNERTTQTTAFGYYHFDGVMAGETVTLSAKARRFKFVQSSIVRTTNESISDADFVSEQ